MTGSAVICVTRYILPVLAVWVVCRCLRSMLSEKYDPEVWGHLIFPDTLEYIPAPLPCLIGNVSSAGPNLRTLWSIPRIFPGFTPF